MNNSQNNSSTKNNNNNSAPKAKKKNNNKRQKQSESNGKPFSSPTKAPVAESQKFTNRGPLTLKLPNGSVKIDNTEFIDTLSTTSNSQFNVPYRYRVNAASQTTFKWLSQIAKNFETYKFEKLKFHYKPRTGTQTPGAVILAPDYDAQDGAPTLETILGQMIDAVEDAPWRAITVDLKPGRMCRAYKSHFCMDDARFDATNQDEKTIDAAQLFIGFDNIGGTAAALTWGKLFVEYCVRLDTPQPATLALDDGGLRVSGAFVQPGPNIFTAQPIISQDPLQGIVEAWGNRFPSSFPTGNAGIFLRDYEGVLTQLLNGTVITALGAPIITQKAGNPLPTVTSRIAPTINAAQTLAFRTDWIKATAGDFFGFGGSNSTTASGLNAWFGGSHFY